MNNAFYLLFSIVVMILSLSLDNLISILLRECSDYLLAARPINIRRRCEISETMSGRLKLARLEKVVCQNGSYSPDKAFLYSRWELLCWFEEWLCVLLPKMWGCLMIWCRQKSSIQHWRIVRDDSLIYRRFWLLQTSFDSERDLLLFHCRW